jgi:Nucleotidyltransferase domain
MRRICAIVDFVTADVKEVFGARCAAVYLMGSLARGGFSPVASDIDIGVVLCDPLTTADGDVIGAISRRAQVLDSSIQNKVSIFWGSVQSLNRTVDAGRYPPFDRLDLIDHGRLLTGCDIRSQLTRPTQQELITAGAEFALDYLATPERMADFAHVARIPAGGIVYLTKTVLFPARFLYLEHHAAIAGNDESARFYSERFTGADSDLVRNALRWRTAPLPSNPQVVHLLERGLAPLYRRFLDRYIDRLDSYDETELAQRLRHWHAQLDAPPQS